MRIGTHGRLFDPKRSAHAVVGIIERIHQAGAVAVLERGLADGLRGAGFTLPAESDVMDHVEGAGLDLLISLGGDGSFLDAVAFVGASGVPLLGINLGRLGFLSNTRSEDTERTLEAVVARRFTLEDRTLLQLTGCEGFGAQNTALNEVSLHKRDTATMMAVHAYLDDRFMNTYWADGLIIATPTGSTAYSLSCGGPLLDPACDAMVVTAIAPHNLNVRPFVLPGGSTLRLVPDARSERYLVSLDSRSVTLDDPMELTVRRADHRIRMVRLEGQDFLDTLRAKLAWGLDVRSSTTPGAASGGTGR